MAKKPPTDKSLLKAALRKAFSRFEVQRQLKQALIIEHYDPKRKRVKTWIRCPECKLPDAISNLQLDHIDPVVPVNKTLEDLTNQEIFDRIICSPANLKPMCKKCHLKKTKIEGKERKAFRDLKKPKKKRNKK